MNSCMPKLRKRVRDLRLTLLLIWLAVTCMPIWTARHPGLRIGDWPLDFWMAAQGCVLLYLALVVVYAWLVNKWEREAGASSIELPVQER